MNGYLRGLTAAREAGAHVLLPSADEPTLPRVIIPADHTRDRNETQRRRR